MPPPADVAWTSDFVVALNPDGDSKLPYLIRLPMGENGIVLKAREMWPRTAKVFCHRDAIWPAQPQIVEVVPVRSCVRRGAAIDLVLDRSRENRSQFVLTRIKGGREAVFWQTARTRKQARPAVAVPRARAHGLRDMVITVDSHERYAWTFSDQQASTRKAPLTAGDYGVFDGDRLVAAVERKSLPDLASSLTTGRLKFAMGDLASLPHAAVVVEARWSEVFKLTSVRPSVVAEAVAEYAVRWPSVPIHFAETRKLAQEWAFRFLGAALAEHHLSRGADEFAAQLNPGTAATPAEIRAWASAHGIPVPARGRIPASIRDLYERRR